MQPSDWDNRFWRDRIPRYNAILDKHCTAYRRTCLRPRTSSTDPSKPPLAPSKSSALHESVLAQVLSEIEQVWKVHRLPEDCKRLYRTMFARMSTQEVAQFVAREVPRLREGSACVQQALNAIEGREEQLVRVKKVVARLGLLQVEALQWKLAEAVLQLRTASLQTAEFIFALIDQIKGVASRPEALIFPWRERDYIAKMTSDLGFLRKSKVSRLLNAGSSADPMLLSTALKPPENQELLIHTGREKLSPQVIEGKIVIPVLRKEVERLLYVNTRLAKECGLSSIHAVRPPAERSSGTNSRFGASADPAKPILPLRLKVLIQRFQTAATDEDSSAYHTRAVSRTEDSREMDWEEIQEWAMEAVVGEMVACELWEWQLAELTLFTLIDALLLDTAIEERTSSPAALPVLSSTSPLQPSLSPLVCYEGQLLALLQTYYQHLPASLLNLSEKAGHLCSLALQSAQPCYYWILCNSLLCGLVVYYREAADVVVAHLSTLEEDWFGLVLPCVLEKLQGEKGRIVIPLHTWNGDEGEIQKYSESFLNSGFQVISEGKWSQYKRVYARILSSEPNIGNIMLNSSIENSAIYWYFNKIDISLFIPSFEIREIGEISYIRLKSALISVSNTGEKQVKIRDLAGNFEVLFKSVKESPDLSSAEAVQRLLAETGEETQGEVWVPGFKKQGISLFEDMRRDAELGVSGRPAVLAFPLVFAVLQSSASVLCATYVTSASDGS